MSTDRKQQDTRKAAGGIPAAIYWLMLPDEERPGAFSWVNRAPISHGPFLGDDIKGLYPRPEDLRDRPVPPPLAGIWQPREVKEDVPFPRGMDLISVSWVLGLSQRAVDVLRDMLEPNGEILPLIMPKGVGTFFLYRMRKIADVLDLEKSRLEYVPIGHLALRIDYHQFRTDQLAGLSIFQIPERLYSVYVTEEFVSRVRQSGLKGFKFVKVWPLPPKADGQPLADGAAKPKSESKIVGKMHCRAFTKGKELDSVTEALARYQKELGIDVSGMDAAAIQEFIAQTLQRKRDGGSLPKGITEEGRKDLPFWLAMAWGDVLARKHQWQWQMLADEGGHFATAIVSPDRSLAVSVLGYFDRQISAVDQTSYLLYNMIIAGEFKAAPDELKLLG